MERFDLIIAGAGPAGAALACAVAPWFRRIAVVDIHPPCDTAVPPADPRTLALAHTSARILSGLGVWRQVSESATPIRKVRLFRAGDHIESGLDGSDQPFGALGFTVAAQTLRAALHRRLRTPPVYWFTPDRIEAVHIGESGARATLGDGRVIEGRLLVGADGSHSRIREALGIVTRGDDYHQQALLAEFSASPAAQHTAFEVLTDGGPLALLPHRGRWSMIWVQDETEAEAAMSLDAAAFIARIESQLGGRLTVSQLLGQRLRYPLHRVQAWTLTGERTALLGNAAHTVHPVGAQGLNLGLRDVATLAELLAQGVRAGIDPGDPALLDHYAERRYRDHLRVLAFTDSLAHLLGDAAHPLHRWLGTGLRLLGALPPLQRGLVKLGTGGLDAPTRLSRGLPL